MWSRSLRKRTVLQDGAPRRAVSELAGRAARKLEQRFAVLADGVGVRRAW